MFSPDVFRGPVSSAVPQRVSRPTKLLDTMKSDGHFRRNVKYRTLVVATGRLRPSVRSYEQESTRCDRDERRMCETARATVQ
jgi:hypothetical protein